MSPVRSRLCPLIASPAESRISDTRSTSGGAAQDSMKAGSLPDLEVGTVSVRALRTPSYRPHKPTGQAVVTLNGRDFYLGRFGSPESRTEGSSQSGAQSIVYELDTLWSTGRRSLEQLSLVILCSCANKSQTNTTGQCQVAAGSIWDGPKKPVHARNRTAGPP